VYVCMRAAGDSQFGAPAAMALYPSTHEEPVAAIFHKVAAAKTATLTSLGQGSLPA